MRADHNHVRPHGRQREMQSGAFSSRVHDQECSFAYRTTASSSSSKCGRHISSSCGDGSNSVVASWDAAFKTSGPDAVVAAGPGLQEDDAGADRRHVHVPRSRHALLGRRLLLRPPGHLLHAAVAVTFYQLTWRRLWTGVLGGVDRSRSYLLRSRCRWHLVHDNERPDDAVRELTQLLDESNFSLNFSSRPSSRRRRCDLARSIVRSFNFIVYLLSSSTFRHHVREVFSGRLQRLARRRLDVARRNLVAVDPVSVPVRHPPPQPPPPRSPPFALVAAVPHEPMSTSVVNNNCQD